MTNGETQAHEAMKAARLASVDAMAHAQHGRRVWRCFARWHTETLDALSRYARIAEVQAMIRGHHARRHLSVGWRVWHSVLAERRHRCEQERLLFHFAALGSLRVFCKPHLAKGFAAWLKHARRSSRKLLLLARRRRGVHALRTERAAQRRAQKRVAFVAALQLKALQYLQLQQCCRAWTTWLRASYSDLHSQRRKHLRLMRRARLARPAKARAFVRWRAYRLLLIRLHELHECDRIASYGCRLLGKEIRATEAQAADTAGEVRCHALPRTVHYCPIASCTSAPLR